MRKIQIDIVSDVMCPWCYIGKRNLEAAQSLLDDTELEVHWRPYQLDPTIPPEGKDRKQYLSEKFGGDARASEIYERVNQAGRATGIDFNFEGIEVSPNTLNAHRLIRWAGGQGPEMQDKVVTRLFQLYFEEGVDIGDIEVLVKAADACGMDGELVRQLLSSDADLEAVQGEIAHAQSIGVTGVPCFIIDQRHGVMGAQPAEALVQAIEKVISDKESEPEAGK